MTTDTPQVLRGRLLAPRAETPALDLLDDALVSIDADGRVVDVSPAPPGCRVPVTAPGCVWLPGFVDAHVHFPQTRVRGSASGPLLTWLERTVFPEEARFAERAYAEAVAVEFCDALLAQGTTCAAVYSSSDPDATDAIFAEMARRGLRGWVGLTLMDRGAPADVLLEADAAIAAAERLAARWDGHDGRLRFCVTPRFALSCTPTLLRRAGALAAAADLPVQTHLSENRDEIAATLAAFPGAESYFGVYAAHGLARPGALFAHCIWLDDAEWDALAAARCAVAHCPDSNFFLGSGCMALDAPTRRGVPVGLGTDVGAGRTFSLRRVVARAYDAALITGSEADAEALLWRATLGGAEAMGLADRVGRVAPGFDADLVAVPVPAAADTRARLLDALAFRLDAPPVAQVWVRGRRLR